MNKTAHSWDFETCGFFLICVSLKFGTLYNLNKILCNKLQRKNKKNKFFFGKTRKKLELFLKLGKSKKIVIKTRIGQNNWGKN